MTLQHKDLASGRWRKLSLVEQMAHIGSEVLRTLSWQQRGNKEYARLAFFRALELIDLTLQVPMAGHRLRELTRLRAALVDYFAGENIFSSTEISWKRYFDAFTFAARSSK